MFPSYRLLLVLTLVLLAGSMVAQDSSPVPVVLNVTVSDASGRFVSDLPAEAFEVLHDGHLAPITLFTPGASSPVSMSLLVDTSTSMEEEMEDVRNALRQRRHVESHDL